MQNSAMRGKLEGGLVQIGGGSKRGERARASSRRIPPQNMDETMQGPSSGGWAVDWLDRGRSTYLLTATTEEEEESNGVDGKKRDEDEDE
ncbi:hypothetical protein AJ79_08844 [Helicocarpus griseus UAMH5409]|uniref:Uncharacterized protein n=1 Tax=Helicocarpus griseus UAMH5409 TaxID=1447875 RepID=A0A2B7WPV2_9EURO|nr:hypothetical protein AJ79_08844 [Helicocarpus griseus UAMH5409]